MNIVDDISKYWSVLKRPILAHWKYKKDNISYYGFEIDVSSIIHGLIVPSCKSLVYVFTKTNHNSVYAPKYMIVKSFNRHDIEFGEIV